MTGSIVINASNLHVGGGVQVATSFLDELTRLPFAAKCSILVSTKVHQELSGLGSSVDRFLSYQIFNTYGISALWSRLNTLLKGSEVVFTVFGPLYCLRPLKRSIVGFAQPWVIYPENEVYKALPLHRRLLTRLKFKVQSAFFSLADDLVVELDHVRDGLTNAGITSMNRVHVVPNCINAVFFQPDRWLPIKLPLQPKTLRIGSLGRAYPHKNLAIIPEVKKILRKEHGLEVEFYVTLTESEWAQTSDDFRQSTVNAGPLSLVECPSFYSHMNGIFFPSLLECFSATPLEALAMKKPLFASDRLFVRQVCREHAHYFEPTRPEHAAAVIASYFKDPECQRTSDAAAASRHVDRYSNPRARALRYIELLGGT